MEVFFGKCSFVKHLNKRKRLNVLYTLKYRLGYCSHEYSVIYYAMAIRQPEILIACPCDSYKTFRDGKCKCDKKRGIPMGHQTPCEICMNKEFEEVNRLLMGCFVILDVTQRACIS